jgi:hypothetical protein
MKKDEIDQSFKEFNKLSYELNDLLHGKNIGIVMPVLAHMLACAGYMQGLSKDSLITTIALSVAQVYSDLEAASEEEVIH